MSIRVQSNMNDNIAVIAREDSNCSVFSSDSHFTKVIYLVRGPNISLGMKGQTEVASQVSGT